MLANVIIYGSRVTTRDISCNLKQRKMFDKALTCTPWRNAYILHVPVVESTTHMHACDMHACE